MCLFPKIIKNKKYVANKKNRGIIPPVLDERMKFIPTGCGNCMECRKQKARAWGIRMQEEIKVHKNGKFVTLTFSDESIQELKKGIDLKGYNLDNAIATKGVRRFLERWRKKYKKSVRHWLITELGQTRTERIHIHGIIWTDEIEEISKIWKYGIVTIGKRRFDKGKKINDKSLGYVNNKSINYIIKYLSKQDEKHKEYKSKILTSPGIGKNYIGTHNQKLNKYKGENTKETYTTKNGINLNLPIYYRNKIFTEEEREKLWIQKLDKKEIYVNGRKICLKNGDEDYINVLKEEQRKNKKLGYGDNRINWERRRYENSRRNYLKKKAIKEKNKKEINEVPKGNIGEAFGESFR